MPKKPRPDPKPGSKKKPHDQPNTASKRDKEDGAPPHDVHRGTTDADETLDREGYQAFD